MMSDLFNRIEQYLINLPIDSNLFFTLLALFFIISAIFNWDWVYDGPYNSVKNPIGYWFGRTPFRIVVILLGALILYLTWLL